MHDFRSDDPQPTVGDIVVFINRSFGIDRENRPKMRRAKVISVDGPNTVTLQIGVDLDTEVADGDTFSNIPKTRGQPMESGIWDFIR